MYKFYHKNSSKSKRLTPFVVMGALAGCSWWIIKDCFLCPHGHEASYSRYLFAHALQGGIIVGAVYHPSAILYGMIMGTFAGNSIFLQ